MTLSLLLLHNFIIRLEIEGSGKTWRQDQRIRLRHVDTGGYLHSHDRKYTRIAGGQQEVGLT
jgi:dolichyl-phosphate-mannose--protein O-mannosyl transferase